MKFTFSRITVFLRSILIFTALISLNSCTSTNKPKIKENAVLGLHKVPYLDNETERKSDLIFHFLKGELELNRENFELAKRDFTKAGGLSLSDDSTLRVQLVRLHLANGDLEKALEENERVIAETPDYSGYFLQGSLLHTLERYLEAQAYYQKCIKLEPKDIVARLFLAHTFYMEKESDSAIKLMREVIKLQPQTALGYYYLGTLSRQIGALPQSTEYFKKALALEADNKKVEMAYVLSLLLNNKTKEARSILQGIPARWGNTNLVLIVQAIETLLDDGETQKTKDFLLNFVGADAIDLIELRRHIGILEVEQRDFISAIQNFRLVLAKNPNDSKARYFLGTAYAALGMKKKAVEELLLVNSEDQMYVEAKTFASFLLRQQKRLDEAEVALKDAINSMPEPDINIEFFLVDLLRAQDKFDEALEIVEAMIQRAPQDEKVLFTYGTLLDEVGDKDEAVSIMEKLLSINSSHSQAMNFIAYALAEKGIQLDRALELSRKALMDYPDDGYFLDTLGWIYYQRADYEKAADLLSRAVNLTGDDLVISEHYAFSLAAIGKGDRALRLLIGVVDRLDDPSDDEERLIKRRSLDKINELLAADPKLKKIADAAGLKLK